VFGGIGSNAQYLDLTTQSILLVMVNLELPTGLQGAFRSEL